MDANQHAEHRAGLFARSTTTALMSAARVLAGRPPTPQAALEVAAIIDEVERRHPAAAVDLNAWLNEDPDLTETGQAAYLERLAAALPANVA